MHFSHKATEKLQSLSSNRNYTDSKHCPGKCRVSSSVEQEQNRTTGAAAVNSENVPGSQRNKSQSCASVTTQSKQKWCKQLVRFVTFSKKTFQTSKHTLLKMSGFGQEIWKSNNFFPLALKLKEKMTCFTTCCKVRINFFYLSGYLLLVDPKGFLMPEWLIGKCGLLAPTLWVIQLNRTFDGLIKRKCNE